jgi:hypothetical protein
MGPRHCVSRLGVSVVFVCPCVCGSIRWGVVWRGPGTAWSRMSWEAVVGLHVSGAPGALGGVWGLVLIISSGVLVSALPVGRFKCGGATLGAWRTHWATVAQ